VAFSVEYAFDLFFENINLTADLRDVANTRRDRLISLLGKHFEILEAFPTGSIPRFTAVREHADVDVIVALHYGQHIKGKLPSEVLQSVRDALAEYETTVRKNGQAVTLYYKTGPDVDIVPAARLVDSEGKTIGFEIPDMNREVWINSRPRTHTKNIDARATSCGSAFRKVIKMAKWWNRSHSSYLQSYHLEAVAVTTYSGQMSDMSWDMFQFFDSACTKLGNLLWYEGAYVDGYLVGDDRTEALQRTERARDLARSAWYATWGPSPDHKKAIELWRQVFGSEFPAYG
jgi:hypothetical protein